QLRQAASGARNTIEFLRTIECVTRGSPAVEYGLILALIFLAIIGGIQAFGAVATTLWSDIADAAAAVMGG
ncbi:hypothetical protein A3726_16035, partial [Erythrobacter sp. HI0037]